MTPTYTHATVRSRYLNQLNYQEGAGLDCSHFLLEPRRREIERKSTWDLKERNGERSIWRNGREGVRVRGGPGNTLLSFGNEALSQSAN